MVNTTSNASGKQSYPMWEEGVADSLADKLGISQSYISRIEKKVINGLKKSFI